MFLLHVDDSDTIISSECIMRSNSKFRKWTQVGHRDNTPGTLTFYGEGSSTLLSLSLIKSKGLYYCSQACYMPAEDPSRVLIPRGMVNRISIEPSDMQCLHTNAQVAPTMDKSGEIRRTKFTWKPMMPAKQLESGTLGSEAWVLRGMAIGRHPGLCHGYP